MMYRQISKRHIAKLLLFVILALSVRFFYLIPSSVLTIKVHSLNLIIIILLMLISTGEKNATKKVRDRFEPWIIFSIILLLISSFVANCVYGQPFMSGVNIQIRIFQYLLLYFPIKKLIECEILKKKDIIDVLNIFCIVLLLVITIQYFAPNGKTFLSCIVSNRLGRTRVYAEYGYFCLWQTILLEGFLNRKNRIINAILIVWVFLIQVFVIQSRAIVLGCIIIVFSIVALKRNLGIRKIGYICTFLVIAYYIFSFTPIGINIVNTMQASDTSMIIRENARAYYMNAFKESVIFGWGYADPSYPNTYTLSGQSQGFYYVDNGIIGILFYYGLIGLLWAVWGGILFVKKSLEIHSDKGISFALSYIIYEISMSLTVQYDFFRAIAVFPIFMILLFCDCKEHSKNAENTN